APTPPAHYTLSLHDALPILMTTRGVNEASWVYAVTYGGGIVGGDAIRLNVDVERGARGVLSTQASTKVYRSLRPSSQHLIASVRSEEHTSELQSLRQLVCRL